MTKIIAMVHYPPEDRFPTDRKYFTNMDNILDKNWDEIECFTLQFSHHYFHNWGENIEVGTSCVCGKEIYNG